MTHTPAYQLPTQVSPERYAIRLTPDLRAFTFDGEETVDITVHAPATEIVLNAIELTIHSVSVSGPDGQTLDGTVSLDSEQERASFHFPQPLATSAAWLVMPPLAVKMALATRIPSISSGLVSSRTRITSLSVLAHFTASSEVNTIWPMICAKDV